MINKNGINFFIKFCSLNNKYYLPIDIRKKIWEYCYDVNKIYCINCNKILVNININLKKIDNECNYSIINGYGNCWDCY